MSLANTPADPCRIEAVKHLPFPDQHYVNSAIGWLELGNHAEAHAEAERISVPGRTHQDAFLVRWRIASRAANWTQAHQLATVHTRVCPTQANGWIYLSYSLYRLRRPLEAWMHLIPKIHAFPNIGAVPYILACFASELGSPSLAQRFLAQSKALGGPSELKGRALETEDLDALAANASVLPQAADASPLSTNRLNQGLFGYNL